MRGVGLVGLAMAAAVALGSDAWAATPAGPGPALSKAQVEAFAKLYVGAVNSPAGIDAYLQHDAEDAPRAAITFFFQDQGWINGGGVDLIGARLRPGARPVIEIAVRNRIYGSVQGVELTIGRPDGGEPKVVYSDLTPAPAWAVRPAVPLSEAEFSARVLALVDKGCGAGLFSGAVLVAAGERVLAQQACGEASRRYHVANTTATLFNLASMDKMFTAVAAMQLAEAGKLSLDASLDRYLDAGWLNPEVARKVTVWQLLTHTSGLAPDVVDALEAQPRDRFRQLAAFKPLVRDAHLTFTPGERFEYSNTGMLLMGAVIAEVSGEDYYDYVQRHVLAPAGMSASGSFAIDDPVENLAMGYYRPITGGWRENSVHNMLRGIPAGGGYSTVGDLHRFAVALKSGKLVSAASLDRLWADEERRNYGAGFEVGHGAVGVSVGHSGLDRGVSTRMRLYLERGYVVVVLANMDRAAPPLLDAIEGELLQAPKMGR